jgi:hypothetical protein
MLISGQHLAAEQAGWAEEARLCPLTVSAIKPLQAAAWH